MNAAGIQAEIMQVALDKYLGSEDQWCQGALARTKNGDSLHSALHDEAVQHCAEGAIMAAAYDVLMTNPYNRLIPTGGIYSHVFKGVEQVLVEQHPEFVEAVRKANGGDDFAKGSSLPLFNDGSFIGGNSSPMVGHPGVGYAGIRAAFEKYLTVCEEKGL